MSVRKARGARALLLRSAARGALRIGSLAERVRPAPRPYLLVILNVTAISGVGLARLEIDNRIETWTDTSQVSSPDFEEGDFLALVHAGPAADEEGFLARDRRLTALGAAAEGAREVVSVSAVLERLGCRTLAGLGDAARFLDGHLLTGRREVATVRIELDRGIRRDAFVARLGAALAKESPPPALLGPAAFNAALDEQSRMESARIFPIAAGALVLLLGLFLGPARALAVMGWAILGPVWLLGSMGWLGLPLDFVSISVPVILLVAELSLLIHPVQVLSSARRSLSLRRLSIRTLPGAALSTLTSAGGFLTLTFGPSPVVRRFGFLCAAAMLLALLATALALPVVAGLGGGSSRLASRLHSALLERLRHLGRRLERRPFLSFGGVAAVVAAGSVLALRIPVDHQPLDFLSHRDPLRMACEKLGDRAGGLAPLELSLDLGIDPWSAAGLRKLESCAASAAGAAGTDSCFSLAEIVKLAAARMAGGTPGSYALPADDSRLETASRLARLSSGDEAARFVSPRGACRLVLPLPILGGREFQAVTGRVLTRLDAACPGGARPLGIVHRLMALQDGILSSQASGLVAGLAGAALLLGAVLGSGRATLAAVLVNMAPLCLAAAYMSLRRVALDLSTAMVASISLGISVDDSARFLWAYRRAARHGSRPAALALEQAGPATVLAGTILAAGFGIVALARFPPIARFGGITAATLLGSIVCHIFVLPGLLGAKGCTPPPSTPRTGETS